MSDAVRTYVKELELYSSTASVLLKQRDNLIDRASNEGLLEAVAKRLSENLSQGPPSTSQSPNQPVRGRVLSPAPSVRPVGTERRSGSLIHQTNPSTNRRRQVRRSPKVIIPKANRTGHPLRCVQISPQTISQLQSRAVTESWEDSETESGPPRADTLVEESSEDELLHDTPKPADTPRPAKPAKPPKSARPTLRTNAAPSARLEHIEWVFWVQADHAGYWRPLSDFPSATQTLFKRKFNDDFLRKPYHVTYYARMLRNRESYLSRDQCVGNVTYANRNEASTRSMARGDKKKTSNTCLRAGRFCARVVEVGDVVKLGFFPVPEATTATATATASWEDLPYWVGEKKVRKTKA